MKFLDFLKSLFGEKPEAEPEKMPEKKPEEKPEEMSVEMSEETPEEMPEEKAPEMVLRSVDNGGIVHYVLSSYFTKKVEWVSLETDGDGKPLVVREPEEVTCQYSRREPFILAGKQYPNLNRFLRKMENDWAEDIYGRKVLCARELYPCFDSYDYMNENRYHRWFLIREGDRLSRLFMSDDRDKIFVTEDVANVESDVWKLMQETGFCQPPEE